MFKTIKESKIEIWCAEYISGLRQQKDRNKIIVQIEHTTGKDYICEVVEAEELKLKEENEALKEENHALNKRLEHLLKSKFIRQYDTYDPKTHTYKDDILKLDEEIEKYKSALLKDGEKNE